MQRIDPRAVRRSVHRACWARCAIKEGTYARSCRLVERAGLPAFDGANDPADDRLVVRLIQLIVSTREYQMA